MSPLILNIGAGWRRLANIGTRTALPHGKNPGTPDLGSCVDSGANLKFFEYRKFCCSRRDSKF